MARRKAPSQTIPYPVASVANGVSQQAPTLRLPNQVQEAINIRSTVLGGVGPRSGSTHIAKYAINDTDPTNAMQFQFDRGDDGQFTGIATKQGIRVFEVGGSERAVSYPSGKSFFSGVDDPALDLSFVSAGNYMFLANRKTEVAMDPTKLSPALVNEAFLFFRAQSYDQSLTITLTNSATGATCTWSFKAPTTAGAVAVALNNSVAANAVATKMTTNVDMTPAAQGVSSASQAWVSTASSGLAATFGYTIVAYKNICRITRTDGVDFQVTVLDASGSGQNVSGINKVVQSLNDLPANFWPGSIVRISGAINDVTLDYWVEYTEKTTDGLASSGYWKEVPAPNTLITLDPMTMPWALQLNDDGSFTFDKVDWDDRTCGSADTLPAPSFVGGGITGLTFTRARLCLVMSDGIVTSRSDDNPFSFWRQSSTQQLDTDPIDLINGTEDVVDIHAVTLVGQDPVLFSSKRQLALLSPQGTALSPNVAELMAVSAFQTPSRTALPISYGTTAFFAVPGASFCGVEQYSLNTDSNRPTGDTTPVTDHVPAYIPAKVWQFAECSSENLLFVVAGDNRNQIYCYQFLDTSDQGRVQSAWSRWQFDADCNILSMSIFDKMATLLIYRADGLYLEQMDLSADRLVGPAAIDVVLDRQVVPTILYDQSDGWTFVTSGWTVDQDDASAWYVVTKKPDGTILEPYQCSWRNATMMKVNADLRGQTFVMGRAPRCYLELSEPVARLQGQDNSIYNDVTIKKVGPIFGQSTGCVMRVGYKSRRSFDKMLAVGQGLRWDGQPAIPMTSPITLTPANGEYIYIFEAQAEDTAPRRFVTATGRTNDILIAFENNGPRSFKVVGAMFLLSVTPRYTGL